MQTLKVVGKELRRYTPKDSNEEKVYRKLHVVWSPVKEDGMEGSKVEEVGGLDEETYYNAQLGAEYAPHWYFYKTKTGTGARIDGLDPVSAAVSK